MLVSGLVFVGWVFSSLVSVSSLLPRSIYSLERKSSRVLIGVGTGGFQLKCVSWYCAM